MSVIEMLHRVRDEAGHRRGPPASEWKIVCMQMCSLDISSCAKFNICFSYSISMICSLEVLVSLHKGESKRNKIKSVKQMKRILFIKICMHAYSEK